MRKPKLTARSEYFSRAGKSISLPWLRQIATLRLSSAQGIEWHAHSEIEILCCLKGRLGYEFYRREGAVLGAWDALVIPADVKHRIVNGMESPSRGCSIFLSPRPTALCETSFFSRGEYRKLLTRLLARTPHPFPIPHNQRQPLNEIINRLGDDKPLSLAEQVRFRSHMVSFLIGCATVERPSSQGITEQIMDEAANYLTLHYAEKLPIEKLIAKIGYGHTRFFEKFKERHGVTPLEWLTRHRMDKAKEMLAETPNASISHIAQCIGIQDPLYFSRVFRRYVGTSPSAFGHRGGRELTPLVE